MFLFKKKPLVLDCFTHIPPVFMFSKPVLGKHALPDWWRALPNNKNRLSWGDPTKTNNMRGCVGVIDYYKNSVVLPLWSDLDVTVGPAGDDTYRYQFSDGFSSIEPHSHQQYQGFADPAHFQHLKLVSPWAFRTKDSVSWVASWPTYNETSPNKYLILPGTNNFAYSPGTNVQMLVFKQPGQPVELALTHGTPMYAFHPLTDRPVDIRTHLVSDDEFKRATAASCTYKFNKAGMSTRLLIKRGEVQQCPIHKGSHD